MISGLPVITTKWTAAAGELVKDGENGYILPLEQELWAEKIEGLLTNAEKWRRFSRNARESVLEFSFEKTAQGIIDAIEFLERNR